MTKYLAVFTILLSVHLSCSNAKIDTSFIHRIAQEDVKFPSQFSNVIFFCKGVNNTFLIMDIYQLRELYKNEFADLSYYNFLENVLNQKIVINSAQYTGFEIDDKVDSLYMKININKFRDFYCIQRGENIYYLKREVNDVQRNTVLYYLFIHNYLTRIDDYTGAFVIRKSRDLVNR